MCDVMIDVIFPPRALADKIAELTEVAKVHPISFLAFVIAVRHRCNWTFITYLKAITGFLPSSRNRTIVTEARLNLLSLYKKKNVHQDIPKFNQIETRLIFI